MARLKVTQTRSEIGGKQNQRDTLRSLGLKRIGDVVVIEDLAYFGMDFRKDYSVPGQPPFQPSVAHYAKDWVMLISSSKAFSYAGERVGMMVVSEALWNKRAPDLKRYYASDLFSHAMVFGAIYALCAGVAHSAQRALAARQDALVGLLTGNIERGARAKLRPTGLLPFFRVGAYGSDSADRRRLPAVARERAEILLGHPFPFARITIIGDTPKDVDAARTASIRRVQLSSEKGSRAWASTLTDS